MASRRTLQASLRYLLPATSLGGSLCYSACEEPTPSKNRLLFVGTGSSTGCPRPACPLLYSEASKQHLTPKLQELREDMAQYCVVSNLAGQGDPKTNKNYRNNPSLLISFVPPGESKPKNILIDAGKTFREGALRWFPDNGIATIDAIILTHQHMDAAGGLDDVRGFQHYINLHNRPAHVPPQSIPMPLYLAPPCHQSLQTSFPWLLPKPKKHQKEDPNAIQRHVASFQVTMMEHFQSYDIHGLKVWALPVMHGEDFVSLGFAFTVGQTNVLYLSDISRMLPETMTFIHDHLPPTDILVIDALHPTRRNPVHYSLEQAVALAEEIAPKQQTYLVGMNCDSFPPHEAANEMLRKKYGPKIQLAHDGLVLETR